MHPDTIFVLIPLLAIITGGCIAIAAIRARMERQKLIFQAKIAESSGGETAAALRKLEDRVRVLERIVTDGKTNLAHEIDQLRDPPRL
jgi:hypothetical protein